MPLLLRNFIAILCAFSCLALKEMQQGNPAAKSVQFPVTFEAQVRVSANDGDFINARKTAIVLAIKDAVKQAIDHLLADSKKTLNPRTLRKIVSNARQYVKSYNFLYADDNLDDMSEEVGLEITLYSDALKKNLRSLGVLSESENQGSILILIRETGLIADQDISFWDYVPMSENALIQKFAAAGVPIISRNALKERVTEQVVLSAIHGDLAAALEIGIQFGVGTIIVGNATTSKLKSFNNGENETVQVNISVKTISVPKGTVIAAKSDFASAQGESLLEGELQAYEEASIRLSTFLLNSLKLLDENSVPPKSSRSSGSSDSPLPFTDL